MIAKGVSKYQALSLLQQYTSLQYCPLSKYGKGEFKGKYFYWEFEVQPTVLSSTYRVLIVFHSDNYSPDIYILDKDVWGISQQKIIPHLYDQKKVKLCLYYPTYKEWTNKIPLCGTIVQWIYLWLYYYEEWLYSEEWKGGGIHPQVNNSEEVEERSLTPLERIRGQKKKKTKSKKNQEKAAAVVNQIFEKRKKVYLESLSSLGEQE
ncbi:hypothetical protein [Sulfurovum sp.]|jgi:hypothetical protein|uniref:hypothetical protein n=1 Tax=Sulfurovum sp. TaxID=1969726 RepID=UPI002A35931B|nr:hypothetical protein [Sulfurovum sp.]MDY0402431.1 hypothetical protein [Sulfurovum sp.]